MFIARIEFHRGDYKVVAHCETKAEAMDSVEACVKHGCWTTSGDNMYFWPGNSIKAATIQPAVEGQEYTVAEIAYPQDEDDLDDSDEEAQEQPTEHQQIVIVIQSMPSFEVNPTLYTTTGKPTVDYLEDVLNIEVSASARDAAWDEVTAE